MTHQPASASTTPRCLSGGYSKVHLVIDGTERAKCGIVPTWDGWTLPLTQEDFNAQIARFGLQAVCCGRCYRKEATR